MLILVLFIASPASEAEPLNGVKVSTREHGFQQQRDVRRLFATIFGQIGNPSVAFAAKKDINACVANCAAIK